MGAGVLETRELKSVMAGVWWRGQWDVIRFGRDKWEFEIQVIKDSVVDGCQPVKLKLHGLSSEPCEKSNFIIVKVGSLKDVKVLLMLLRMSRRVVNVASNGRLT